MPVELNLRVGGAECPCAVEAAAGNWALWRCGCLVGPRCPASCKKLGLGVCMNIVQALRVALLGAPPNTFFEDTFMW